MKELVRFDPGGHKGNRLRARDRVTNDLVERAIVGDRSPCLVLGANWAACPVDDQAVGLRLVDDEGALLLSREEAAEARVRELEEELARRGK